MNAAEAVVINGRIKEGALAKFSQTHMHSCIRACMHACRGIHIYMHACIHSGVKHMTNAEFGQKTLIRREPFSLFLEAAFKAKCCFFVCEYMRMSKQNSFCHHPLGQQHCAGFVLWLGMPVQVFACLKMEH